MEYFLIVDSLNNEPGTYGTKKPSNKFLKFILENFVENDFYETSLNNYQRFIQNLESLRANKLVAYFLSQFENVLEFTKIDIPNKNLISISDGNTIKSNINTIYPNCITIPEFFVSNFIDYKNRIFHNAFKSSEHLETILSKNSNNVLVIVPLYIAKDYFKVDQLTTGLYVSNLEYTELYPLADFTVTKWNRIINGIDHCFSHLGATYIKIEHKTETAQKKDIEIKQLKGLCVKFGTSFNLNKKFEYTRNIADKIFDKRLAENYIGLFREDFPNLYSTAKNAMINPLTGSLILKESLDLKFKLDIQVISAFQGAFGGSYYREFDVTIKF